MFIVGAVLNITDRPRAGVCENTNIANILLFIYNYIIISIVHD